MFKEHNMTVFRTSVILVEETEKSTIKVSPTGLTLNMRTFVVDRENVNICIIGHNELSNVVFVHATKALGGMKLWLHSFLTVALNESQWSASLPS
jgi:sortase (surface protein transpeptidase)